jgi:hypothetical protein
MIGLCKQSSHTIHLCSKIRPNLLLDNAPRLPTAPGQAIFLCKRRRPIQASAIDCRLPNSPITQAGQEIP